MLVIKVIAKTIAISVGVFVLTVVALAVLAGVGLPPAILAPAAWFSFAAFGYFQSKNLWCSQKPWVWAAAGLFLGILAFPFFWFCCEHYRATAAKAEVAPEASRAVAGEGTPVLACAVEEATLQSRFLVH
jgi:Na+/H+ antiporter NhaC